MRWGLSKIHEWRQRDGLTPKKKGSMMLGII